MTAKLLNHKSRKADRSIAPCLAVLEPDCISGLFKALHNPKDASIKVNIPPSQGKDFSPAHSCSERQQHRPIDVHMPNSLEEVQALFDR
jgi:hypothetical protein